jgi:hypothetical protein
MKILKGIAAKRNGDGVVWCESIVGMLRDRWTNRCTYPTLMRRWRC